MCARVWSALWPGWAEAAGDSRARRRRPRARTISAVSAEPRKYGRYQIVEPLGSGSMGTVYLARDELLGRDVALKVLRGSVLAGAAASLFRQRFANEAKAVASLAHPNVVRVFDMGFEGDAPFLVMEYVRGTSLAAKRGDGVLPVEEVRRIAIDISRGLAAAHAANVLHRDVKPENILIAGDGTAKLADFGVARIPDSNLTLTGQFLGTPRYGAPEAKLMGSFSGAADVFSLGVTLYEALTGRSPLGAGVMTDRPPPIAQLRPEVPLDLDRLILRMIAVEAKDRPAAAAVASELERAPAVATAIPQTSPVAVIAKPVRRGGIRPIWVVAAGLVLLIVAWFLFAGGSPASLTPAERMRLVEQKVNKGKIRDARDELQRVLVDDPQNQQAREWLERLNRVLSAE
jgi:serine/threonine protein kinase